MVNRRNYPTDLTDEEWELLELEGSCVTSSQLENLALIWVDAGYTGPNFARVVKQLTGAEVEVVKRSDSGFQILPRRWVVERTFGWLCQNRRLVVDYELLPETSTSMIYLAMIRLMLRRLTA